MIPHFEKCLFLLRFIHIVRLILKRLNVFISYIWNQIYNILEYNNYIWNVIVNISEYNFKSWLSNVNVRRIYIMHVENVTPIHKQFMNNLILTPLQFFQPHGGTYIFTQFTRHFRGNSLHNAPFQQTISARKCSGNTLWSTIHTTRMCVIKNIWKPLRANPRFLQVWNRLFGSG